MAHIRNIIIGNNYYIKHFYRLCKIRYKIPKIKTSNYREINYFPTLNLDFY